MHFSSAVPPGKSLLMNVDGELNDVNYVLLGLPFDITSIYLRVPDTLCYAHPGNAVFYSLCP